MKKYILGAILLPLSLTIQAQQELQVSPHSLEFASLKSSEIDPKNPYGLTDKDPVKSAKDDFSYINFGDQWKKIQVAGTQTWDTSPWGAEIPYAHFCAKKEGVAADVQSRVKLLYTKPINLDEIEIRKVILTMQAFSPKAKSGIRIYLSDKSDDPMKYTDLYFVTGDKAKNIEETFVVQEFAIPETAKGLQYLFIEAWGENNDLGDTDWRIANLRIGLDKLNPRLILVTEECFAGSTIIGSKEEVKANVSVLAKDRKTTNASIKLALEAGDKSAFKLASSVVSVWNETTPILIPISFKPNQEGLNEDKLVLTFEGKEYTVKLKGNGLNSENPYDVMSDKVVEEFDLKADIKEGAWKTIPKIGGYAFTPETKGEESYLVYDVSQSKDNRNQAILLTPAVDLEKALDKELTLQLRVSKMAEEEYIPELRIDFINQKDNEQERVKILELGEPSETLAVEDAKAYLSETFIEKKFKLTKELLPKGKLGLIKFTVSAAPVYKKIAKWQIGKCSLKGKRSAADKLRVDTIKLFVRNNTIELITPRQESLSVYTMQGELLFQTMTKGHNTYVLPYAGVFIVKVGKYVEKINVL